MTINQPVRTIRVAPIVRHNLTVGFWDDDSQKSFIVWDKDYKSRKMAEKISKRFTESPRHDLYNVVINSYVA